jgi:hypothetical protein
MDETERALKRETEKWLSKIENVKYEVNNSSKEVKNTLKNMKAYIDDCKYFLKQGDMIRAFEAVVYAWGIYETLLHLGIVTREEKP